VLDEPLEDLIRRVEVDAHDQAGDEDDDGALDDLRLGRPLDLLQLGPGLEGEAAAARARNAALASLGFDRLRRADLSLALPRPLCQAC